MRRDIPQVGAPRDESAAAYRGMHIAAPASVLPALLLTVDAEAGSMAGPDDQRMRDFKPYVFPLGRRLDGCLAERWSSDRDLVVPTLEVEELDDAYVVTAVVPGACKDEIAISFEDGALRVAGEMPWTDASADDRVRRGALSFRAFSREVRIARAIDIDRAEAHFEDGVLTARLPFANSAEPEECRHALLKVT